MASNASASLALLSQTPTPIAQLHPDITDHPSRVVRGEVTIKWPYNSVTKTIAFLLAEPDVLLRRARGQVRLQLHGSSAKAVVDAGIGAGDEVTFSLDGVQWAKDDSPGRIPGARLEWQLQFTERLVLQVKLGESGETKLIDIDHPASEVNGLEEVEHAHEAQSELSPSEPIAADATPAVRRIVDLEPEEYASPAFIKRARLSYGSLFEDGLDIFEEDGGVKGKGRKRTRFGTRSNAWRYSSQSPSPEPEQAFESEQPDDVMEEDSLHEVLKSPSPKPKVTDEDSQTIETDMPPAHPEPIETLAKTPAASPGLETPVVQDQPQPPSMPPPDAGPSPDMREASTAPTKDPVAGSSLFGIFAPSGNDYSEPRFGGSFAAQTSPGLSLADQVRFHISHEPQATYNPIQESSPEPVQDLVNDSANKGVHEPVNDPVHDGIHELDRVPVHEPVDAAVSYFGGQEAYPTTYLDPPSPKEYRDMESYTDAAEQIQGLQTGKQAELTDLALSTVEVSGQEHRDMVAEPVEPTPVGSGRFGSSSLIDGSRISRETPTLQSDAIEACKVPAGFSSYGDSANNISQEVEEEDEQVPVPEKEEYNGIRDFVDNEETHGGVEDDVGVDSYDDAEYDEDGEELEQGDYDQRQYEIPEDDDEGLSEEGDEAEREIRDRYGEKDVFDDEEGEQDDYGDEWEEGQDDGYDESEGEDYDEDYYKQDYPAPPPQPSRTSFMKPAAREPEVIDLISDSDESEDASKKAQVAPSRPAPMATRPPPPSAPPSEPAKKSATAENTPRRESPSAPQTLMSDQSTSQEAVEEPRNSVTGTGQTVVIDFATKFYPDPQQSRSTEDVNREERTVDSGLPREDLAGQDEVRQSRESVDDQSESGSEIEEIDDDQLAPGRQDNRYDEEDYSGSEEDYEFEDRDYESEDGEDSELEEMGDDGPLFGKVEGEEDESADEVVDEKYGDEGEDKKEDRLVGPVKLQGETRVVIDDDDDDDDDRVQIADDVGHETEDLDDQEGVEVEEVEEVKEAADEGLPDDEAVGAGEEANKEDRIDEVDQKSDHAEIRDAVESYSGGQSGESDTDGAEVGTASQNAVEPLENKPKGAESRETVEETEVQRVHETQENSHIPRPEPQADPTGQPESLGPLSQEDYPSEVQVHETEDHETTEDVTHQRPPDGEVVDKEHRSTAIALSPPPTQEIELPVSPGKEPIVEPGAPDEMHTSSPPLTSEANGQEVEHLPTPLGTQTVDEHQPESMLVEVLVEETVETQVTVEDEMEVEQTPSAAADEMSIDTEEPRDEDMMDTDFRHDRADVREEPLDEDMNDGIDTPRPANASSAVAETGPEDDIEITDADDGGWHVVITTTATFEEERISEQIESVNDGAVLISSSQPENMDQAGRPALEVQEDDNNNKEVEQPASESYVDTLNIPGDAETQPQPPRLDPLDSSDNTVSSAITQPAEMERLAAPQAPQSSAEVPSSPTAQTPDQPADAATGENIEDVITVGTLDDGENTESKERGGSTTHSSDGHQLSSPDLSIQFARQAVAARRGKRTLEPLRTSPRLVRPRSGSLQMSATPEAGDEDNSMLLARAALASPSKRSSVAESDTTTVSSSATAAAASGSATATALKNELIKRLRTDLKECVPLKSLRHYMDKRLSVAAVAAAPPPDAIRARHGPREYLLPLRVTDPSLVPATGVIEAQVFRPHKDKLPLVRPGDAVLLREFRVVALPGKGFGLRSCDESAWAVFEAAEDGGDEHEGGGGGGGGDELPQIRGPPVEDWELYTEYMAGLRAWYRALGRSAREKLERANQRLDEMAVPNGET